MRSNLLELRREYHSVLGPGQREIRSQQFLTSYDSMIRRYVTKLQGQVHLMTYQNSRDAIIKTAFPVCRWMREFWETPWTKRLSRSGEIMKIISQYTALLDRNKQELSSVKFFRATQNALDGLIEWTNRRWWSERGSSACKRVSFMSYEQRRWRI